VRAIASCDQIADLDRPQSDHGLAHGQDFTPLARATAPFARTGARSRRPLSRRRKLSANTREVVDQCLGSDRLANPDLADPDLVNPLI